MIGFFFSGSPPEPPTSRPSPSPSTGGRESLNIACPAPSVPPLTGVAIISPPALAPTPTLENSGNEYPMGFALDVPALPDVDAEADAPEEDPGPDAEAEAEARGFLRGRPRGRFCGAPGAASWV